MKEFEVRFDGIPVGIAHATDLPKSLGPDSQFTLKCDVSIQRSPTMTMTVESPVDPVWDKFMKEWMENLHQPNVYSMGCKVEPQYGLSAMFQPEPKLIAPYKLKWHSHGVIVIGADDHHFYADDTLRSGRQARVWAKDKIRTQDTQITGRVGIMHGTTFHTGGPRLDECVIPANTVDTRAVNQEELLARLKEFSDVNPGLDWSTPVYELTNLRHIPIESESPTEITFAVDWGNVIRKEDHAVIKINPGT